MFWPFFTTKQRWRQLAQQRQQVSSALASTASITVAHTGDDDVVAAKRAFLATLDTPLPEPASALSSLKLLAIDLETTGLKPQHDEIISIGWVPMEAGRIHIAGSGHHIILPESSVGQSAVIHGIRDCDRHDGIPLAQGLQHLFTALKGRWPVFHHGGLDLGFLNQACRQLWQQDWPTLYFDTLQWQRRRFLQRHKPIKNNSLQLTNVLRHHQLPQRQAHNALDDAQSCAEVMLALCKKSQAMVDQVAQIHS